MSLVEMCIAVGLSGFFVLMLSGMLSQTLVLSTVSQNELIAAHAAEELLENARVMTYQEISGLEGSVVVLDQPITFLVNSDGTASQTALRPTSMPVQLDLTDSNVVYGEVSPTSSPIISATRKWQPGSGNYFRGTATEIITKVSNGTTSWYQITVNLSYDGGTGSNTPNTKTLTRTACVFDQGLNFRQ